ncbi:ATP-binding protein [Brucella anthropi]|uniref:ATP-binding protein n=1 Tax=Brucella anthropi TaxID=529 RepID=UPI002361DB35|nr:ATP-binding protein [Brucella anthropi]
MKVVIGEVTAVMGVEVTLRAYESSNLETHFVAGKRFKGVSIRELIAIEHGFHDIICIVEGEYLDERNIEKDGAKTVYVRKLKTRPLGYFSDGVFKDGIKFLPKIGDPARLLSVDEITSVYERKNDHGFVLGKLLKEDIKVSLPWKRLFNTHIGIFGNTGSGKSNTLTKLYTILFDEKFYNLEEKSRFVFLDFNGEYTGSQLIGKKRKKVLKLSTRADYGDRFELSNKEFWDPETLGILFQATANTQKPFIKRVVAGRNKYQSAQDGLANYIKAAFSAVLNSEAPNAEALELLKTLTRHLGMGDLLERINQIGLFRGNGASTFFVDVNQVRYWFDQGKDTYATKIAPLLDGINTIHIIGFDELQVRAELRLIFDLLHGSVQYEHIQPLMRRIDAFKDDLARVVTVSSNPNNQDVITVISLRECKQDIKKIVPILIAKHFYEEHKANRPSPPDKTLHLVIDEAHNILSQQSAREAESWKDYRLELFEEIIKEGRKFGIFITISSQRPADISPTIISQLHNYFIHRLVNDRDLTLLENTISTLDNVSRSQIPNLPQGACVVTGTSFDIPMLLQVDKLSKEEEPDSGDVDLEKLWYSDDGIFE